MSKDKKMMLRFVCLRIPGFAVIEIHAKLFQGSAVHRTIAVEKSAIIPQEVDCRFFSNQMKNSEMHFLELYNSLIKAYN